MGGKIYYILHKGTSFYIELTFHFISFHAFTLQCKCYTLLVYTGIVNKLNYFYISTIYSIEILRTGENDGIFVHVHGFRWNDHHAICAFFCSFLKWTFLPVNKLIVSMFVPVKVNWLSFVPHFIDRVANGWFLLNFWDWIGDEFVDKTTEKCWFMFYFISSCIFNQLFSHY